MNILRLNPVLRWFLSMTTELFFSVNEVALDRSDRGEAKSTQVGPYSLVQLAYQGELIKQGIPSHVALMEAHYIGHINAITLVRSAVQTKLLSPIALTNTTYLNAVETAFLLHYLLHPDACNQEKHGQSKGLETTEMTRQIEHHYFLERRLFW